VIGGAFSFSSRVPETIGFFLACFFRDLCDDWGIGLQGKKVDSGLPNVEPQAIKR
jgi:hypothetical protein